MTDILPLLDMQRLTEMRREFGEDLLPELHALFISEAGALIGRMATADQAALSPLLHTLKGSAQTMGMARLVLVCKQAETAWHEGEKVDPALISDLVRASAEAFGAACGACQIRNSARIGSEVMSR